MEKTKRVKIVTGLKCNIRCVFCYYQDSLKAPNRGPGEIKRDLLYAKRHGVLEIDFSGGEPTVHPDLPRLISEAKSMGMEKVCIISNGWRLADRVYLKSLRGAGLDEILFSLHGSTEGIHDRLTDTPGSFNHLRDALGNAAQEGIEIRINTVVNLINYKDLKGITVFIKPFQPVQVNFITINDWCFAKHLIDKLMVGYSEMAYKLKEACDSLEGDVDVINVRYIPFCFMQGYERFVCNHKQVMYDRFEWVPRIRARLEVQNNILRYIGIIGYGFFRCGGFKDLFKMPIVDVMDESVVEAIRHWFYKKHPVCKRCRFDNICDGVEKTYADKFGLSELSPEYGKKILDPVVFRRQR